MKKLIWKLRFMHRMWSRSRMSVKWLWTQATVAMEEAEDWQDENPRDYADEEMDCWSQ